MKQQIILENFRQAIKDMPDTSEIPKKWVIGDHPEAYQEARAALALAAFDDFCSELPDTTKWGEGMLREYRKTRRRIRETAR